MTGTAPRHGRGWRARSVLSGPDDATFDAFVAGTLPRPAETLAALSMFSNAGIGDYGYRRAGFTFHAHSEIVKERLDVCGLNHPGAASVLGDLNETWGMLVDEYRARCDQAPLLLTAMPPCQGMSSASNAARSRERSASAQKSAKERVNTDPRNVLSFLVAKVAQRLKPQFVVVENVPGILWTRVTDPDSGAEGAVAQLLTRRMVGYDAYAATIQFADYGVPQRRLRTIITYVRSETAAASRLRESERWPFPATTHARAPTGAAKPWVTIRSYLEAMNLQPLDARKDGKSASREDPLHFVPVYDERRYLWVSTIPPHGGRGAFENGCVECRADDVPLSRATCPNCGANLVARPHVVVGGDRIRLIRGHNSSYRRMRSDLPSTTITTATGHLGSDANIHPWENRLLSPRECALLQSVPRSFRWSAEGSALPPATHLREMIGEALPPWYGYLHGLALRLALGRQSLTPLLRSQAAECQRLDISDLEALQADRRRRLDAARKRRRPETPLFQVA